MAGLVGRSEEWLRQVETGARRLDSVKVAINLSRVLHIEDMAALLGFNHRPPVTTPTYGYDTLADRLRTAIVDQPALSGPASRPPAPVARETLTALWRDWQFGTDRFTSIAAGLPQLVVSLRNGGAFGSAETAQLLVGAYHLSRSFLTKLGELRLAAVAADRGMLLAEWTGERLSLLVAARNLAMFHLQAGEDREAIAAAAGAAQQLGATAPEELDHAVLWGSLRTIVAKAAARQQEKPLVDECLDQIRQAADRLGADRECRHVWFGPSDVAITEAHLALVLGDVDQALRLASRITIADGFPASQRTAFYATLAEGHVRRREDAAAVFALLQVEDACAEEIRHNRSVARTLAALLERGNATTRAQVHRLAGFARLRDGPT